MGVRCPCKAAHLPAAFSALRGDDALTCGPLSAVLRAALRAVALCTPPAGGVTRGLSAKQTGGEILIPSSFKSGSGRFIGFSPSVSPAASHLPRQREALVNACPSFARSRAVTTTPLGERRGRSRGNWFPLEGAPMGAAQLGRGFRGNRRDLPACGQATRRATCHRHVVLEGAFQAPPMICNYEKEDHSLNDPLFHGADGGT